MNHRNQARDEAIAAGRNKYQGRPCRYGHAGLHYVRNGECVECAMARKERGTK